MPQRLAASVLVIVVGTGSVSAQRATPSTKDVPLFLSVGQSIQVETRTGRRLTGTVEAVFADVFHLTSPGQRIEIPYAAVEALRDAVTGRVVQRFDHHRVSRRAKILIGAGVGVTVLLWNPYFRCLVFHCKWS
jgi:hypothetical protein